MLDFWYGYEFQIPFVNTIIRTMILEAIKDLETEFQESFYFGITNEYNYCEFRCTFNRFNSNPTPFFQHNEDMIELEKPRLEEICKILCRTFNVNKVRYKYAI